MCNRLRGPRPPANQRLSDSTPQREKLSIGISLDGLARFACQCTDFPPGALSGITAERVDVASTPLPNAAHGAAGGAGGMQGGGQAYATLAGQATSYPRRKRSSVRRN